MAGKYSANQMKSMGAKGQAFKGPGGALSYPIADAADLKNAIHAVGRGGADHDAIRKYVMGRAKALGMADQIPDNWNSDGSMRSTPEMSETERRYTPGVVQVRADGIVKRIGGYAAVFNKLSGNLGGFVEQVSATAFNEARMHGWPSVVARYNHNELMLLGTSDAGTLRLNVDDSGLLYEVEPPPSRADVYELVERGDVRKSSFAFRVMGSSGDSWTTTE